MLNFIPSFKFHEHRSDITFIVSFINHMVACLLGYSPSLKMYQIFWTYNVLLLLGIQLLGNVIGIQHSECYYICFHFTVTRGLDWIESTTV